MFSALFFSLSLLSQQPAQDGQTPIPDPGAVQLDDIVVEGQRLNERTRAFVNQVAAPAEGRGVARWRRDLCVGVGNLKADVAQIIVDRVSTLAIELGLEPGPPGCEPGVFIIFADDADAAARDVAAVRRREFRIGVDGTDRGRQAVRAFQTSDLPVRWWQLSVPVNVSTGVSAERLPGEPPLVVDRITRPSDLGPNAMVTPASRLSSPVRDELNRVIIIVDIDRIGAANLSQLSDYIALIALAQVDPQADARGFDSILNLFDAATAPAEGLTDWDRAYLAGLYAAEQDQRNAHARVSAVADALGQQVRRQVAE